jgi:hypothetical protein
VDCVVKLAATLSGTAPVPYLVEWFAAALGHLLGIDVAAPESGPEQVRKAAEDAVQILDENLKGEASIVIEDRADELAEKIQRDLDVPHA